MTRADPTIAKPDRGTILPALAVAGFAFAIGACAYYAPPARGEMAVVFAPGTSQATAYAAILAAGGRFVSSSRLDNIAVAYAEDSGFGARVRSFGGLFTLAARGLCASAALSKEATS